MKLTSISLRVSGDPINCFLIDFPHLQWNCQVNLFYGGSKSLLHFKLKILEFESWIRSGWASWALNPRFSWFFSVISWIQFFNLKRKISRTFYYALNKFSDKTKKENGNSLWFRDCRISWFRSHFLDMIEDPTKKKAETFECSFEEKLRDHFQTF